MTRKSLVVAVRDLVRGEVVLIAHALNPAVFVRDTLPVCVRDLHIPLKDIQFVHIADLDVTTGEISPVAHEIIPTDIYKWKPENEADPVSADAVKEAVNG